MVQKSKTSDERFILQAYQSACEKGDIYCEQNRYEIGQKVGLHPKAVQAITKLLFRANFIKLIGENEMVLTKNGESLALRLMEE